jgi:hypothetical protein
MAETERDEKVARAYRALGGEEPPRALDDAILARARRRASHWRVPLSIAAVLVLAVGVTLRLQHERGEAESVALAPQVIETPRPAPAAAPAPRAADAAPRSASTPAAAAGAVAEAPMKREAAAKPAEAALAPEAWLERIAEMRKQGRTREAEESLAEFRKRYPGYKIPEALR